MTRIPLTHGWRLYIIEANEQSPMCDHGRLELAADDENKRIYAFDVWAITMGLGAVESACREYIAGKSTQLKDD